MSFGSQKLVHTDGTMHHLGIDAVTPRVILVPDPQEGVPLATAVGVPMYADIFGTIPVAESLLAKGAGLGTILSFMMGVTTLSLPSMVMLSKAIKKKLLGTFIGIVCIGIIIVGYGFNVII